MYKQQSAKGATCQPIDTTAQAARTVKVIKRRGGDGNVAVNEVKVKIKITKQKNITALIIDKHPLQAASCSTCKKQEARSKKRR